MSPAPVRAQLPAANIPSKIRSHLHLSNLERKQLVWSLVMEARNSWAIFYKGKVIPIGDDMINWIRRDPTEIWGWFEIDLMQVWKNMFPLTKMSKNLGYLPLKDEAWSLTPNPWWRFLLD